jgi:CDP-diacylglycerol--glycerol-3-phosphate 3-phosphatidyltransferase
VKSAVKAQARAVLVPWARFLANVGISPDHLTWTGLVISGGAGVLAGMGWFRWAALALLAGAFCDMLDGSVARASGSATRFGAFLDSTVDRVSEAFYFAGILLYFSRVHPSPLYAVLSLAALAASFLVSYTRARAEGLGVECNVGWMERPERLVLLMIASAVGPAGIRIALWLLTVLAGWTSVQRMAHVRRATREP